MVIVVSVLLMSLLLLLNKRELSVVCRGPFTSNSTFFALIQHVRVCVCVLVEKCRLLLCYVTACLFELENFHISIIYLNSPWVHMYRIMQENASRCLYIRALYFSWLEKTGGPCNVCKTYGVTYRYSE